MCLKIDTLITPKFDRKGRCLAYKVVETDRYATGPDLAYRSRYQHTRFPASGPYRGNRPGKELMKIEQLIGEVHQGVHVFLRLVDAQKSADNWYHVMEVLCLEEDLVAAGVWSDFPRPDQAVFMAVEVLGPVGSWEARLEKERLAAAARRKPRATKPAAGKPARKPRKKKETKPCA